MNEKYGECYQELQTALQTMQESDIYGDMSRLVDASRKTVSMNRKLMEKSIDVSWVEAIEEGLLHVDNVVRNPRRTIVDVEEVVPIALSKKITVDSIKHLAQHTDLIQSIDEKKGTITPSKILNVHKEESLETYENRFVNTLIDRLYIFIMTRYEKLSQVDKDEEIFAVEMESDIDDKQGNETTIHISIASKKSLEATNDSGYTIWQRVEKLKKTLEGYKGSELCQALGNNFVHPPIMRTNAIMKNVDLKACLALWQYILGYEKIGYEINIEDTAVQPSAEYMSDLSQMVACNLFLFRGYTDRTRSKYVPLGKRKFKGVQPKVVKRYKAELLSGHYDVHTEGAAGYIQTEGLERYENSELPENIDSIFEQIERVIQIERNYYREEERKLKEAQALKEEQERLQRQREARLEEKRRIEEARKEERERIQREKEAEEKRVQEMLERRKAEIEAEERERARIEEERRARLEEERRLAEEMAAQKAEQEKLDQEKQAIRGGLGEAEGVDIAVFDKKKEEEERSTALGSVTADDIEEAVNKIEETAQKQEEIQAIAEELGEEAPEIQQPEVKSEYEDPKEIAARMKLEQQKEEKARKEKERAARLKAERQVYESKPFDEIRKQYSKNPIYAIPRFFRWLFFVLFGIIPKDTDNPDWKRIRAEREEAIRKEEYERGEREKFEVYYKKYATNFPYNIRRFFEDQKFKRKRKKAAKSKPKPVWNPPKRTAEENKAIEMQMKKLYKDYHVSAIEHIRRKLHDFKHRNDDQAA